MQLLSGTSIKTTFLQNNCWTCLPYPTKCWATKRQEALKAMMHGYFKMGNALCRMVSNTSLFMCKIRVLIVSMACPFYVYAVSGHHRLKVHRMEIHHVNRCMDLQELTELKRGILEET